MGVNYSESIILWQAGNRRIAYSAPVAKQKKTRGIGRPTNKGSIGKEVLIEKTAQLLRTLPPEKLSLTAAAQAANVHLTLLKYYFQDRTRLLTEVARHLTVTLGKKVEAAEDDRPPPPERLRIRIDAMVDFYVENPFYHRLMVEIMAETEDPLAAELINRLDVPHPRDLSRHHGRWRRTRLAAPARCVVHVSGHDGTVRAVSLQPSSLRRPHHRARGRGQALQGIPVRLRVQRHRSPTQAARRRSNQYSTSAARNRGDASAAYMAPALQWLLSIAAAVPGPIVAASRPTPPAQPMPVARIEVG